MTTPSHLGGHLNITNMDEPLLKWIKERIGILTMLDLGCGPGGMVDAALKMGIKAWGIDGDSSINHKYVVHHDFSTGIVFGKHREDLIWCVEFVEHVERRFMGNFLCLFPLARYIFMTHALPGQGGHHHVNEQPSDYWIDVVESLGFVHDKDLSVQAREQATNKYTKSTGMIFVNRSQVSQEWGP